MRYATNRPPWRAPADSSQERLHVVRRLAYHAVLGVSRRTDRDRRVPGRRHRDQRPQRRRLRADRGGRSAHRRRRAPRPLGLAGPHGVAAAAGRPAADRDHPGDGRGGALARGRAARSRGATRGAGDGRPQRPVRPPGAASGIRPHRLGLAQPAGVVHRGTGPDAVAAATPPRPARGRRRARDRRRGRAPGAGGRRDVRAGAVRAVPAAVCQRAHDPRRGGDAGATTAAAGQAAVDPGGGRAVLPQAPPARLRQAPARPRRVPVPRRLGPDPVRRQVGVDPQPGPRALRSVEPTGRLDRARRDRRLPDD